MPKSSLIPSTWEIPDYFHGRLGDRPGRQRAMVHEGHLLLVLHEPPRHGVNTRKVRLFYRRPDGSWLSSTVGSGLSGLEKHLEELEKSIELLDTREDRASTADDYLGLVEQILPLQRSIANLHATLDDARKQVTEARELINCRDHAYDISRAAELLSEAIQAGAHLAQTRRSEELAVHGQRMAESAHRLNLLVAFFFPLATLATVFGMELHSGLNDVGHPGPFLLICLLGLLLGIALLLSIVRRPGVAAPPASTATNPSTNPSANSPAKRQA